MQFVYIHGFGTTGKESTKFKMIVDFTTKYQLSAYALEWKPLQKEIVSDLQKQLEAVIDYNRPICFIGSSTGGNFCIQLMQNIPLLKKCTSILINPFVTIEQRKIDDARFPKSLADQMEVSTSQFSKSLVLLGENDEVLDSQVTSNVLKDSHEIVWVKNENHSLNDYLNEHFEKHFAKNNAIKKVLFFRKGLLNIYF